MFPMARSNNPLAASGVAPFNRLSDIFDRMWNDDFFAPLATPGVAGVPLSIWEDEERLYVEVDAPGIKEKDIDVSIHNGELLIRGERKCEGKANGYDTRSYGRFEQRISLPMWAKSEQVDAKLADGVLLLTFTKGEEAKPKRIAVKTD
jgi:HSP20 family protein